jgi:hypothetical protein
MNKTEVSNIIETTLKSGNKTPGLFDLPKILSVKSKLESCDSIADVVWVLNENRSLISKSFGISEAIFDNGLSKLNSLNTTA